MTFNEYQELAKTTAIYPKEKALEYLMLGLASECGELCSKYKKIIRDNQGIITKDKRKELLFENFDCLWYISQIASELGYALEDGAQQNIDKLLSRKERGKIGGSGDSR